MHCLWSRRGRRRPHGRVACAERGGRLVGQRARDGAHLVDDLLLDGANSDLATSCAPAMKWSPFGSLAIRPGAFSRSWASCLSVSWARCSAVGSLIRPGAFSRSWVSWL